MLGGRATHVADIHKDKISESLQSRPLARKTHTLRVAISDMANEVRPRCGGVGPACCLCPGHGPPSKRPGVTMAVRDRGPRTGPRR